MSRPALRRGRGSSVNVVLTRYTHCFIIAIYIKRLLNSNVTFVEKVLHQRKLSKFMLDMLIKLNTNVVTVVKSFPN